MTRVDAMSNSSPPTSATRIRAEPMPGHAPIFHLVRATRPHTSRDPAVRCRDISYIEGLQQEHSAPGVKAATCGVRMLFDWLITGQVLPTNPAAAMRGPKHVVKTGKTPVLEGAEWRKLLESIPATTLRDLRSCADRHPHLFLRAHFRGLEDEGRRPAGRAAPARRSGSTRKAASSTPCRAITRLPRRCGPTSTRPASPRTARAGCSAPRAGTTAAPYPTKI
jgi:hypothetical protein